MSDGPPDRFNVSIPPSDDDLDLDRIDEAVEQSDYATRSAFVRAAIRGEVALDDVLDS
jgi:metal-responsive CopG/Arc/MetJ family transcriptional regulator